MGTITDSIALVFRDFVSEGIPSSGIHDPPKSEIRAIGPLIETAIGNAGLGALVSVTKTTTALLDADLAHDADTVALVYADATDANNDLYVKTGASGTGAWTNSGALHAIIDGLAAGYVAQAEAAADAATASATQLDGTQRWYLTRRQVVFGQADTNRTAALAVFIDGTRQEFTDLDNLTADAATLGELTVAGGTLRAPDRYYLFRKQVSIGLGDTALKAQFATFVDGSNSQSVRQIGDAAAVGGIVCLGDSLTQGVSGGPSYPAQLAATTGRDVVNLGIGGQQGFQIAARMGAIGVPLTVSGNSLSAGANSVTAINGTAPQSVLAASPAGFFATNLQLLSTQDANARSIKGVLGSVRGTLNRTATLVSGSYTSASTETYTFTPDAGQTLPAKVPPGAMFVADYAYADRTHVFWLFRNNYLTPGYLDVLDACIRRLGHGRYVVMPVINGDNLGERSSSADPTNYNTIRAIEDALANRYAGRFLPIRRLLIDKALTALGITPTAQDIIDVADDTVPDSLRLDSIHLTTDCDGFVADEVSSFLTFAGY